jgi:hypothetical protein
MAIMNGQIVAALSAPQGILALGLMIAVRCAIRWLRRVAS